MIEYKLDDEAADEAESQMKQKQLKKHLMKLTHLKAATKISK